MRKYIYTYIYEYIYTYIYTYIYIYLYKAIVVIRGIAHCFRDCVYNTIVDH